MRAPNEQEYLKVVAGCRSHETAFHLRPGARLEYAVTYEFSHLACRYPAGDRLDRVGS